MDSNLRNKLINNALLARKQSYAPYSNYCVGACALTFDDSFYSGCNIENASYGATVCAERTAIFKAVSEGHLRLKAIAIAGGVRDKEIKDYAFPCGICRQVMREFCDPDTFIVYVAKSENDFKEYLLKDLLPDSFGPGFDD